MTDDPRNFLLSHAARVSAAVIDRIGKENVEAAFLSGGVARGETAFYRSRSGVEVYSDLDLFFVVRPGSDLERTRRAAREAAAGVRAESDGWTLFAAADIGVFTLEDFLSQKARPGTAEIAGSHVVLHGPAEIPEKARIFSPAEIEPEEALYLLENRLLELRALAGRLGEDRREGFLRYARYVLWKSSLDAGSSALIVLGRFHPSRAERMRRLADARSSGACLSLLPEEDCGRLFSWHECLSDLQGALGKHPPPDRAAVEETARLLLGNWKRTARYISDIRTNDWNELFEWRCKAGRWLANARELSALARRTSRFRIPVLARARRLAWLSPVDALRLSGAARMLAEWETSGDERGAPLGSPDSGGYAGFVDDLTRAFGYGSGDAFERAGRMFEDTR